MNEVKTVFKKMALYYFLLAINIIPCASVIPDAFPFRNISAIYLMGLGICLILYYSHRVVQSGALSVLMKSLSWMALLLILLRGVKYGVFARVDIIARHIWYMYYIPMLLLPLFLFYISLLVSPKDELRIPRGWLWVSAVTVTFIVLVLTNDLHQLVFIFQPGFKNWDSDYSHGFLFYVLTVWQYALYLAAVMVLVIKCRVTSAKKNAWIIFIPFAIGITMCSLLITGKMPKINNTNIVEFPEALIFMVVIVLECCIQLGLIPTNTDYGKLFQKFSISAQITDDKGKPVYSSYSATALTKEQFETQNTTRIGEHTVLHKMSIPGGFGFWQDDLTELDRLNEELAQAKEDLAQEAELISLKNELKEKEIKVEQRTLVYDTIAKRTQRQSQAISQLAETARNTDDIEVKEKCRYQITLLGAYIKRYANLMLLSQENSVIQAGELGLSVSEFLRYLNFCGVPGEFFYSSDCTVNADMALAVFEAFETLIEINFSTLKGAFVNLSVQEGKLLFKLTLENAGEFLPPEMLGELGSLGVEGEENQEDDVAYICFTLTKGGKAV